MTIPKIDPYNHAERYIKWRDKSRSEGISDISPENEKTLLQYLSDMENGLNVAFMMKKGPRSYTRLYTLRIRIHFIMKLFEERFNVKDMTKVTEDQLHDLFNQLRTGVIRKSDGNLYASAKDYARDFKAFWHWHQKVSKRNKIEIEDITQYLDTTGVKPKWVYLTEDQVKMLADKCKFEYKVLIWFLFDTGVRAPTELMNIRVADLHNDFKELHIRQETSKTFGRRIKLMLSSNLIKEFVIMKGLKADDYVFKINPGVVNRALKRIALRVLGDKESPARQRYCDLTMYDFRHCSSCYWLPRYKSESALKYRFGWKDSDRIHYYSELLGMKDTIGDDDMLLETQKTEIEKELISTKRENEILQEKQKVTDMQLVQIMKLVTELSREIQLQRGENLQ